MKLPTTDAEWKQNLTADQYNILRRKHTERPFTGAFWNHHDAGTYKCAGCGLELFASASKYDSGCGWPSYTQPLQEERIAKTTDQSLGMERTEVLCSRCGGHLGHVFNDGPAPTGLRYCINSGALTFDSTAPTNGPGDEHD